LGRKRHKLICSHEVFSIRTNPSELWRKIIRSKHSSASKIEAKREHLDLTRICASVSLRNKDDVLALCWNTTCNCMILGVILRSALQSAILPRNYSEIGSWLRAQWLGWTDPQNDRALLRRHRKIDPMTLSSPCNKEVPS
jgi:hypothetical protein